jgi:hypothetical protein
MVDSVGAFKHCRKRAAGAKVLRRRHVSQAPRVAPACDGAIREALTRNHFEYKLL